MQTEQEIQNFVQKIKGNHSADVILWLAYPKKSSKKYRSEINRDSGWITLGDAGFEGVRQIAIDEDWSALRFRNVKFIKSMKRQQKHSMIEEGKQRTKNN